MIPFRAQCHVLYPPSEGNRSKEVENRCLPSSILVLPPGVNASNDLHPSDYGRPAIITVNILSLRISEV